VEYVGLNCWGEEESTLQTNACEYGQHEVYVSQRFICSL